MIPRSGLSPELQTVRQMLYFGIGAMLVLSLLLSLFLARQNTSQIRYVMRRVEEIGYHLDRDNEIDLLDSVIRTQHRSNQTYARELSRRRAWAQNALFEKLLDGREADEQTLTEVALRLPCEKTACVYIDILTGEGEETLYGARMKLEESLAAAGDTVPFWRSLSDTRYQAVWRGETDEGAQEFFRRLTVPSGGENNRIQCFVGPMMADYRDLAASARNAQHAMMLNDPEDGDSVVICQRQKESEIDMIYTEEMDRQIVMNCLQGNPDKARAALEEIRLSANRDGVASRMTEQFLIAGMSKTLLTILSKLPPGFENGEWVMNSLVEIQRRQSLDDLFVFAERCVVLFTEHTSSVKTARRP